DQQGRAAPRRPRSHDHGAGGIRGAGRIDPGFTGSEPVIPLRDKNPTRRTPIVTIGLIVACFLAFGLELSITASGGDAALERFFDQWGAVPARITAAFESGDYLGPATLGMITSMFLHGGW